MSGPIHPQPGAKKVSASFPIEVWAFVFAVAFAALLASFPARSPELWVHLVSGRTLFAQGAFADSWLLDGLLFASYQVVGPSGLVALKALLLALAVGALAWRASQGAPGWGVLLAFSLAVLALGPYLALNAFTFSLIFAVGVVLATDAVPGGTRAGGWAALACGLLWLAAMRQVGDRGQDHALTGWLIGILVLAGGLLDVPSTRRVSQAGFLAVWLALGGLLAALNPGSGFGWIVPPEWGLAGPGVDPFARSPFRPAAWLAARQVPAALAYYPVLALGLGGALLPGTTVPTRWRLPTLVVALLSVWNAQWIPWLALLAGPCVALRIGAWVRGDDGGRKILPPIWLSPLVALLGVALLVLAWPGWLQGAPHERRSLALHLPPAAGVVAAAEAVWKNSGQLDPASRGLHARLSSLAAFSWNQPTLQSTLDLLQDDLAALLNTRQGAEGLARLLRDQKCHLIITEPDPARLQLILQGLLDNPDKFSIWRMDGPIVVAGSTQALPHPPAMEWTRLAFGPSAELVRDFQLSTEKGLASVERSFLRPRPDAEALGLSAEARQWLFLADIRHRQLAGSAASQAWSILAGQWLALAQPQAGPVSVGGSLAWLVASAPGPFSIQGAAPANPGPVTMALAGWKSAALPFPGEGELRALLTLASRRARESVALDPADGRSWLALGEASLRLINSPSERAGANSFGEWRQLREAQASFAFQRAVAADPGLDLAHYNLAYLFSGMGLRDLEARQLRAGWLAVQKRGPAPGMSPAEFKDRQAAQDNEIRRFETEVASRLSDWVRDSAGRSALDRARMALDHGLGQTALDELLASDISAFGAQGMALEVDLLLRMGRADEVLAWLNPAEHEGFLPPDMFHWFRAKAAAAVGDYSEACQEAVSLTQGQSRLALPMAPSMALAIARDSLDRLAAPGNGIAATWNRLPPNDLDSQLSTMLRRWRLEMNGFAVLGLLSLERGDSAEGYRALREALALSPAALPENSGPALDFPAKRLARAVLETLPNQEKPGR